ncbi:MAG: NAD(P)/FAD-dependent oxidoreductase [Elusimicrobiota bacterium]
MERVDIAVVGAGVIGLAVAARCAKGRSLVVLESHDRCGVETSSRNSEVIHAGVYYPPKSLKSRLCREGRRKLYALKDKGVFIKKMGKLIVAVNDEETKRLEIIKKNAEASGAEGLSIVDAAGVRRRIPEIRAEAALWVSESGIMDSEDLMRSFHSQANDDGAIFLFKSPLKRAERRGGCYELTFGPNDEKLEARHVINAGGLHADKIAAMAGIDVDEAGYRLHWCRGRYFRSKRDIRLPHLVYPVPQKHGLGIHLTPDREGRVRLGPDTEFIDRIDYDVDPGLAAGFHESVVRFWPELKAEDLTPDTCGIRPKLSGPNDGFRDFVIQEESARGLPGWVNLLGIESPGLTASPAIAEHVAAMVE